MARRKKEELKTNENNTKVDQKITQSLFEELPVVIKTDEPDLHTMDDFNIELFNELANRKDRPGPVNPTPVAVKSSLRDAVVLLDTLKDYSLDDASNQLCRSINNTAMAVQYKMNSEILNSITGEVDNLVAQAIGNLLKEVSDCIFVHMRIYMEDPDAVDEFDPDISDNDRIADSIRIKIDDLLNDLNSKIVDSMIDSQLATLVNSYYPNTIGSQIVSNAWQSMCDMRNNKDLCTEEKNIIDIVNIAKYNTADAGVFAARCTEVMYNAVQMTIGKHTRSMDKIKEFMYGADGDGIYHTFHEQIVSIINYAQNTIVKYVVSGMLKLPVGNPF